MRGTKSCLNARPHWPRPGKVIPRTAEVKPGQSHQLNQCMLKWANQLPKKSSGCQSLTRLSIGWFVYFRKMCILYHVIRYYVDKYAPIFIIYCKIDSFEIKFLIPYKTLILKKTQKCGRTTWFNLPLLPNLTNCDMQLIVIHSAASVLSYLWLFIHYCILRYWGGVGVRVVVSAYKMRAGLLFWKVANSSWISLRLILKWKDASMAKNTFHKQRVWKKNQNMMVASVMNIVTAVCLKESPMEFNRISFHRDS